MSRKDLVTDDEIEAGNTAIRAALDEAGYGSWVSDEQSRSLAVAVLEAAARVRDAK